jgi:hypothetical protein
MLHNPAVFHNPMDFIPERFSDNDNALKVVGLTFGFGRRCVFCTISLEMSLYTISELAQGRNLPSPLCSLLSQLHLLHVSLVTLLMKMGILLQRMLYTRREQLGMDLLHASTII